MAHGILLLKLAKLVAYLPLLLVRIAQLLQVLNFLLLQLSCQLVYLIRFYQGALYPFCVVLSEVLVITHALICILILCMALFRVQPVVHDDILT